MAQTKSELADVFTSNRVRAGSLRVSGIVSNLNITSVRGALLTLYIQYKCGRWEAEKYNKLFNTRTRILHLCLFSSQDFSGFFLP